MNTTESKFDPSFISGKGAYLADRVIFRVLFTYEIWTEESTEHGDAEERGIEDEYLITLPELLEVLTSEFTWIESSSSNVSARDWLISDDQYSDNYETSDTKTLHLFIKDRDNNDLPNEVIQLFHKIARAADVTDEDEQKLVELFIAELIRRKADYEELIKDSTRAFTWNDLNFAKHVWLYSHGISNALAANVLTVGNYDQEALDNMVDSNLADFLIIPEDDIEFEHADDPTECNQEAFDADGNKACYCDPSDIMRVGNASEAIPNVDLNCFVRLL